MYISCVEFASSLGRSTQGGIKRHKSTSQLMSTFTSSDPKGTGDLSEQQSSPRRFNNLTIRLLSWLVILYFAADIVIIHMDRPSNSCIIAEIPMTIKMLQISVCFNMVTRPEKVRILYHYLYETIPRDRWKQVSNIEPSLRTTTEWRQVYKPTSTYSSPEVCCENSWALNCEQK